MFRKAWVRITALSAAAFVLSVAFFNCGGPKTDSLVETSSSGCDLAPAALRNPTTIDQVTQLINALPKPLTLPCFIENLPAPLKVYAISSTFSAQPAVGPDSPRIFIINGNLVLSVVPAGSGRNLLEYGQIINSLESVKGELEFPINANIPGSEPYEQIRNTSGTTCALCHTAERPVTGFAGNAFASGITRPDPFARQTSTRMRSVASTCDKASDPYRCAILNAVFVKGRAQDTSFP